MSSDASHTPRMRLRNIRLAYAGCLVVLACLAPSLSPAAKARCGAGCPEVCGESECSCGVFNCGSAEFCSLAGDADFCTYPAGCPPGEVYANGCCATLGSPILIDMQGDGFALTNLAGGVKFAIGPTEAVYQVSWSEPASDDAWLVLDRNGNGRIDNGLEMFGNHTPQPEPPRGEDKNGYLALALYDNPARGGNGDGEITASDMIYTALRLWRDANHDGQSEPNEMSTLEAAGIVSINLKYRESKRTDEFGNGFRFRSRVTIFRNGRTQTTDSADIFLRVTRNFT